MIKDLASSAQRCEYFPPTSVIELREWFFKNCLTKKEIWLLFPHKSSDTIGITYVEALGEALCFGWIDSVAKKYDNNITSRRFSLRSSNSSWSEVNKHHARLLIDAGEMTEFGSKFLPDLNPENYVFPDDIIFELQHDKIVWENFCAFPRFYQNIRLAAIDKGRKYPEIFLKRLNYFIKQTRLNKRYGRFR